MSRNMKDAVITTGGVNMPHLDELITCKNCGHFYCAVYKPNCPKCGTLDIVSKSRQFLREKRRQKLNHKPKNNVLP